LLGCSSLFPSRLRLKIKLQIHVNANHNPKILTRATALKWRVGISKTNNNIMETEITSQAPNSYGVLTKLDQGSHTRSPHLKSIREIVI
jgi:hypothetical protein